jgi:RNA polymerase sigma-70 factor (ECF subfamily)
VAVRGRRRASYDRAMTDPATSFEPHRRRLRGLAYRMLGSIAEAEDAVQDAYLRWHGADRDAVSDPRAFLTTTTARICLDVLRSARTRRETYVGPWLPEPVVDAGALAPDAPTELAEDLSIALLLALERLSPLERAAFLLHDVFDCPFAEVAAALDRTETACRQLAARARAHVRKERPRAGAVARPRADLDAAHARLLTAFVEAARSGDLAALRALLTDDARYVLDSDGRAAAAGRQVIEGADRTAKIMLAAAKAGMAAGTVLHFGLVNGMPGIIAYTPDGTARSAAFEIDGDRIRAVYVVMNPAKLGHLARS